VIVTKGGLVARDIDILAEMAEQNLAAVAVSVTTLDNRLAAKLEPRASAPAKRLDAIKALSRAGVPTAVFTSPMIPALNDWELERILDAAKNAGATRASYTLLRLPHDVKDLMIDWLDTHAPGKSKHVLNLVREMRQGQLYDSTFGKRFRGHGPYAEMLEKRFTLACKRLGLAHGAMVWPLDRSQFAPPPKTGDQFALL
ncbi:MAG: radical SAM protein, partial [Pseudomonadota bacterium]